MPIHRVISTLLRQSKRIYYNYMIKAILFDFDDTLVNTLETKTQALKLTGKKYYGLDLTEEEIRKVWGKPFTQLMKELFKNAEEVGKIIEKYTIERDNFPASSYKDVVKTLKILSKKYLLGLITSHAKSYINKDLKTAGIPKQLFFVVQTEEETAVHKPNPKVFDSVLKLLKKRNINKSQILYVGDTLYDYYAARDAGINFYGLPDRTTPKRKFQAEGARTINTLAELTSVL